MPCVACGRSPLVFRLEGGEGGHRRCFPPRLWSVSVMTQTVDELQLRNFMGQVKAGLMSRRAFVRKMIGLGLTGPLASQMLTYAGVARAETKFDYKPNKRGGGGALKVLLWQAPTLLNPHFAIGTKDQ